MVPQANLTEHDQRFRNEPYNPIYNLIPVAPVIVMQCVTRLLTTETWTNANYNLGITIMTV